MWRWTTLTALLVAASDRRLLKALMKALDAALKGGELYKGRGLPVKSVKVSLPHALRHRSLQWSISPRGWHALIHGMIAKNALPHYVQANRIASHIWQALRVRP